MSYNIFSVTKPAMPKVPKTAKIIDFLLKKRVFWYAYPLVPLPFPLLSCRISDAKFVYPDHRTKDLCDEMAHLVADSGANKGQFGTLVEALNADLRAHDYEVLEKIAQITCLQGENDLFMKQE